MNRNVSYDKFVYELVSAEGSVTENGAVAFLAGHLNQNAIEATARTARVFLGMQVQCTQCHDHPFNKWKQAQFWSMNAFFRGTRRRGVRGNRREFGLSDNPSTGVVFFEKRNAVLQATKRTFVDGTGVKMDDEAKPRRQLAKLMTDPSKPFLANAAVNRMWGHFFGYGFTRPVDDMGPHNPPSHPELLKYLADQFKKSGFDTKRLIRWIALSEAYSLSSRYGEKNKVDNPGAGETPLFSKMYLKLFTAEQLYDSLLIATDADKAGRGYDAAQRQRSELAAAVRAGVRHGREQRSNQLRRHDSTGAVADERRARQFSRRRRTGEFPGKRPRRPQRRPATAEAIHGKETPTAQSAPKKTRPVKGQAIVKRIETLYLVALARKPSPKELESLNRAYQEAKYTDPLAGLQDVVLGDLELE